MAYIARLVDGKYLEESETAEFSDNSRKKKILGNEFPERKVPIPRWHFMGFSGAHASMFTKISNFKN
jgi:hypothetical protein